MNITLKKKLVGTTVFASLLLGIFAISSGYVEAQFFSKNERMKIDGVVVAKGDHKLTIDTNGTKPIKVEITDSTKFKPGKTDYADIEVGDTVNVDANVMENGKLEARSVKLLDHAYGHSYGNSPKVKVMEGRVLNKKDGSITIQVDDSKVKATFTINSDTKYPGTSLDEIHRNDHVRVQGFDDGSQFIAKKISLIDDEE